ncbi:nucleolar complex protein 3 homolog [Punica granatum]|uniref:Nucleolar complex protein 3 homolog n=1 Tax=Punica granatum TaxID=22663 RepID=A0A6P8BVU6_PUNGR|nr:nucleolar complex protein 3 homolog [Punica granatum]
MVKQKVILPPELPPEIPEEEIVPSEEDVEFFTKNRGYTRFVYGLDTQTISELLTRPAGVKEDDLEALYEKKRKKEAAMQQKEKGKADVQVDPVDALPVKTLDGKLYYRTLLQVASDEAENAGNEDGGSEAGKGSVGKLTKAERRAKLKKLKKEAKKQGKESPQPQAAQDTPQAVVLAEVKEELTAEEAFESKKRKLAELGDALLADPESNIKSLKELLHFCKDAHHRIVILGLLSLSAVFKDIIPGYRIRLPTEKELEMKVSKDVKKMRNYESNFLSTYKAYLQKLMALEKVPSYQRTVIRCICVLLDAAPHFNFRESLIEVVTRNLTSSDDVVRKLCCDTIKSLFSNEGKHGGEATVEAVRLIADLVKANNCQMPPDSIEVFMCLSFDEDLGRAEAPDKDKKAKSKKNRKGKISETTKPQDNDRIKKNKKHLMSQMRDEVAADYKAATFTPDVAERRKMQSEMLAAVFETYFRILKHTMQSIMPRPVENSGLSVGKGEAHPLLAPCLNGLGKFSHLIDLDYIGDLMNYLKKLASVSDGSSGQSLTVSERLRCCIIAFRFMRNNLDALNVDLQDFFVQLYNIILEYRPGRDQGEVLAEALKMMLCDDRQHDMQKAAAFIKRLATFSLCFGSAESMTALVTLKHLLVKNAKCRILLENDAGGGSVSGSVAKYHPFASDPNQSGALASVLWELNLLSKHYHPAISSLASGISNICQNQAVVSSNLSPQAAFTELSLERVSAFNYGGNAIRKSGNKRKRGGSEASPAIQDVTEEGLVDNEERVRRKLSDHFMLVHNIKENERLRRELDRTSRSLQLYEKYKEEQQQQKKRRKRKAN